MRQRERLILAALLSILGLPLCRADEALETDGAPMARAALPPPLRAAASGPERQQPQPPQTASSRHNPIPSGSPVLNPSQFVTRSSKHPPGRIKSADSVSAFSRKPRVAAVKHNHHRHHDGVNFAGIRGGRQPNRLASSGPSPDPGYGDPPAASPVAMPPMALPPPLFRYTPQAPPGYVYPPQYQPPWLPGPTPPR
jgi:hypothetical protein